MKKRITAAAVVLGILSIGSIAFAQANNASDSSQGEAAITFPIPELGNCGSKDACKIYCSDQSHMESCISFGESHGLMKSDEAARARAFATMTGPGGCRGEECKAYCDAPDHTDECLAFAEAHGLVRAEDVKILKVIRESGGPGGCKSETECRAYCSDNAHGDACQKFAEDNGLAGPRERADAGEQDQQNQTGPHDEHMSGNPKIQEILATTGGPGGCKSEDACKTYCSEQGHMNECLQFGKDNGLMSQEEYDQAKKFADMTGPGGCRGEECKAYCDNGEHLDECLKFGEEKGFISKAEAQNARRFADKPGPGGCKGEECRTYCQDQSHHDECVAFAVQNGFMTQAEADQMQHQMQQNPQGMTGPGGCTGEACKSYCEDAAHRDECISFAKEHGMMGPPRDGAHGDSFEGTPPGGDGQFGPANSGDHGGMVGPGGCKTPEECAAVCKSDPERCKGDFSPAHDQNPPPPNDRGRPDQQPLHPPVNMTPEQQKQYDAYMQNHSNRPDAPEMYPPDTHQPVPDMQPQGHYPQQYQEQPGSAPMQAPQNMTPEQQHMYQQYQQTGTPPVQPNQPTGAPAGPPPPPPSPTSSIAPASLVAAVYSIFAQLLHGF